MSNREFSEGDLPIDWIKVGNLSVVWAESQRRLDEARAQKIADNMNPDSLGALVVGRANSQGIHHIIDGQHRWRAVQILWGNEQKVPCIIIESVVTPQQAAQIWGEYNSGRAGAQAIDEFRIWLTAGRKEEVEVNEIVTDLGYHVSSSSSDGAISAVAACLSIHKKLGSVVLRDTLLLIRQMYGYDRDGVHNNIIRGVAKFYDVTEGEFDEKRMRTKVPKKYTPARLMGAARQAKDFLGGTLADGVCEVLINTYNHGLGGDKRIGGGE